MATESQCRRALDLFENELSQRKNVVGLGIVPADDEAPFGHGSMAVAVYVAKKLPCNRLLKEDVVRDTLRMRTRQGPKEAAIMPDRTYIETTIVSYMKGQPST